MELNHNYFLKELCLYKLQKNTISVEFRHSLISFPSCEAYFSSFHFNRFFSVFVKDKHYCNLHICCGISFSPTYNSSISSFNLHNFYVDSVLETHYLGLNKLKGLVCLVSRKNQFSLPQVIDPFYYSLVLHTLFDMLKDIPIDSYTFPTFCTKMIKI